MQCAAVAPVGPRPLIALYDYTPEESDGLFMEKGMTLELLWGPQAAGAGWCVVRDGSYNTMNTKSYNTKL